MASETNVLIDELDELDDEDGELADMLDNWAQHWEKEFDRAAKAEEEYLSRIAQQVHRMVIQDSACYEEVMTAKMQEADARAKRVSQLAGDVVVLEQANAVAEIRENKEKARLDACHDALQSADDLARNITEGAAARRREREAKRREETRARDAEIEARRLRERQKEAEQEPRRAGATGGNFGGAGAAPGGARADTGAAYGGSAAGSGAGARKPADPPKFTRVPGAHAAAQAAAAAAASPPPPPRITSHAAFDIAWAQFEKQIGQCSTGGAPLGCDDVPWPTFLPTVSGIRIEESPKERKDKIRTAVLRWHPDKWGPILVCIREADHGKVMEKVKEVTRRILEERKRFSKK